MRFKTIIRTCCLIALISATAFAVDGVVLINQATVMAAGGFPYKITQPGSYKLSGNLVVPADTNGINIQANNVSLDLNGFTISGTGVCNGGNGTIATSCSGNPFVQGILIFGSSVTVRNGSVRGFGAGISGGTLIEEIQATDNSIAGIQAAQAIVRRCAADNNGTGFQLNGGVVAESNEASFNVSNGMAAQDSTIIGNALNKNGFDGLVPRNSVFGSNVIMENAVVDIFVCCGFVPLSQNNNRCTQGAC